MSTDLRASEELESLHGQLQDGCAETASLVAAVIDRCEGLAMARPLHAQRLQRVIDEQAWTDVALELVKLELPQWSVRRLAQDDGEWYCGLSRSPALPDGLEDQVDGRGPQVPLAVLDALVEAWRQPVIVSRFDKRWCTNLCITADDHPRG